LIVVDQPAVFISYACDVYIFCLWYYVIFVDTFLPYGLAGCAFIRGDIYCTLHSTVHILHKQVSRKQDLKKGTSRKSKNQCCGSGSVYVILIQEGKNYASK
jgi:hypothetical protein